ncbi:hypothetical protein BC332_14090 [Capsicum chinense]|nr:hypothetical protein BC332_14090 [Capsicum chinense]
MESRKNSRAFTLDTLLPMTNPRRPSPNAASQAPNSPQNRDVTKPISPQFDQVQQGPGRQMPILKPNPPIQDPLNQSMEVAELVNVCWLDITGKIDTKRLTKKTSFAAYLVFKLTDEHQQLEKAIASVRFVKEKVEGTGKEGYTVFISKTKEEGETGRFPYLRSDGWMEIKLGEFFNNLGEDGEVEMKLMETDDFKWKSGLIVKGIDIRPN